MNKPTTDVVIAGGGVIGMAVAYFLSRQRSLSITVIDQKKPGNASWASAGGLWPIGESVGLGCGVIFFKTLSRRRRDSQGSAGEPGGPVVGPDRPHQLPSFFFNLCLRSNQMFPSLWEELHAATGVDFKLERTGLKFVMYDSDDVAYAHQIHASIPHLHHHLRWLDRAELRAEEPFITEQAIGALEFIRDDQVNPYHLVRAYREGARANGVRILDGTDVTGVELAGDRVVAVKTRDTTISCGLLINAAGSWAAGIGHMVGISLPVVPVKGQILLSERLPKSLLRSCLSTSDCYIAQKDNGEVLIGSTTEHKGFDASCELASVESLSRGAIKALPILERIHLKRTWAGLRPGTPDELPILGPVLGVRGYLNACGHFRTGILTSAITGQILSDLVYKQPLSVVLDPFLLSRFDAAMVEQSTEIVIPEELGQDQPYVATDPSPLRAVVA